MEIVNGVRTQAILAWTASAYGVFCLAQVRLPRTKAAGLAVAYWAASMAGCAFNVC